MFHVFGNIYVGEHLHTYIVRTLDVPLCYKLVQGFRVICFITGQYNTKGYGTITDDLCIKQTQMAGAHTTKRLELVLQPLQP